MVKRLKEGETPLFDMSDKDLIRFAYRMQNRFVMDTVAPEMMRRMNVTIKKFNEQSSKQTSKMITLTYWIIGLTVILGIIAALQLILLVR